MKKFCHRPALLCFALSRTTGLHGCVYSFARAPGILTFPPHTTYSFAMAPHVAFWSLVPSTYPIRAHGMVARLSIVRFIHWCVIHALPRSDRLAGSLIYKCKFSRSRCSLSTFSFFAGVAKYKNVSLSQKGRGRPTATCPIETPLTPKIFASFYPLSSQSTGTGRIRVIHTTSRLLPVATCRSPTACIL